MPGGLVPSAELYRLGEGDLAFGELLPEKPGWMEQEEYEREVRSRAEDRVRDALSQRARM